MLRRKRRWLGQRSRLPARLTVRCPWSITLQRRHACADVRTMTRPLAVVVATVLGYQQFAQMGAVGKRTYGDFNAMMSKGGSMENLSMGPQVTEELVKSCKTIVGAFADEMAAGYAAAAKQFDCTNAVECIRPALCDTL